ncbi:MAG TPA: FAD:protein FMN transferase [Candidatus Saccharimonadales bacterium]|nr:FAD:protein FMN transferase [Candidatus Saccharimonadales bacterium]
MVRRRFETMGMTGIIQVAEQSVRQSDVAAIFRLWQTIDQRFSPFKKTSELSQLNRGELKPEQLSEALKTVLALCEQTQTETDGFFNITRPDGQIDPSGLVKGWAIWQGAKLLQTKGYRNFTVEIAGDIQVSGVAQPGRTWRYGIRNPFNPSEIIKTLALTNAGVATSGNYVQGAHIYDPVSGQNLENVASLTVIGPNVYEADRMATAAFAMGEGGLAFIEKLPGFEAYAVLASGRARLTSGFDRLVLQTSTA